MTTAAVFGCTGAVGSQILATLINTDSINSIKTISRNLPNDESSKLESIKEIDTSKWSEMISTLSPKPTILFNAIGTTRSAAGGISNQWKIDHDLCIEIAKSSKSLGIKTFIYISSAGIRSFGSNKVPYSKMKIGVEDAIKELNFDNAIILRPGMILGREKPKIAWLESVFENLNKLGQGLQDMLGQDQTIIGRAAVSASRTVQDGKAPSKFWILEQADIVRLGREEWKE